MTQLAQIVASHGRFYWVECTDHTRLLATSRGKKTHFTCGDWVEIQQLNAEQAVIEKLQPRKTLLYRSDTFRSKLIAANITQMLIVVAVQPSFSDDLLACTLIAAAEADIQPVIILNKIDLPGTEQAQKKLQFYHDQGYQIITLSAKHEVSALWSILQDHASVLVGQSGMGKSTLINALIPDAQARVNAFSIALDSGKHTTTHASLYRLNTNSVLMDSPGLQSFGLQHIAVEKLIQFMPDLCPYIGLCRFHNCQHHNEPGCAIQTAVTDGKIKQTRLALLHRLQQRKAY